MLRPRARATWSIAWSQGAGGGAATTTTSVQINGNVTVAVTLTGAVNDTIPDDAIVEIVDANGTNVAGASNVRVTGTGPVLINASMRAPATAGNYKIRITPQAMGAGVPTTNGQPFVKNLTVTVGGGGTDGP